MCRPISRAKRRTALSVNVKERLDFSCGLFDRDGNLVVNAPHIPVHLGAMGETVRAILAENSPNWGTAYLSVVRFGGVGVPILPELPEADVHQAVSADWRANHNWLCPEGAACLAAIPRLLDERMIRPGDDVVAFNTGSLEKYLPSLRHLL